MLKMRILDMNNSLNGYLFNYLRFKFRQNSYNQTQFGYVSISVSKELCIIKYKQKSKCKKQFSSQVLHQV